MRSLGFACGVLLLVLGAAGCSYLGPSSIAVTRPEYNHVIQETNSRELLLNLVRLRYRDPPYFMQVERVVSALEVERRASGSVQQFVRALMSPTQLDMVLLLAYSGWSVERVFAMTLQEANGLENAPSASGPTPVREPEYKDFRTALRHLRALQTRKAVALGRVDAGGESFIELRVGDDEDDADALAFKRLMGLDPSLNRFRIIAGLGRGDRRSIVVATRPLIAVMNYLAQGIDVPRADLEAGHVTRTVAADSSEFAWQEMLGGLFRVRSGDKPPAEAAVSAQYRGSWFYIADSDLESKSTFVLLSQLMALHSGSETPARPALNFSIGR